jgi:hypothetical protein
MNEFRQSALEISRPLDALPVYSHFNKTFRGLLILSVRETESLATRAFITALKTKDGECKTTNNLSLPLLLPVK